MYENESHLLSQLRIFMFLKWNSEIKDIFLNKLWYYLRDKIIEEYWKMEEFKKIKKTLRFSGF